MIERAANIAKSGNLLFNDYMKYSIPDKGSFLKALGSGLIGNFKIITNINFRGEEK